jgi:predicted DNA-binding transcriptional regulator AlpA
MNADDRADLPAGEHPLLIDASVVAALTQRSVRSVWRDNAEGRLPRPVRVGGAIRWRREEIVRWVAAGCPNREEWESRKEAQ